MLALKRSKPSQGRRIAQDQVRYPARPFVNGALDRGGDVLGFGFAGWGHSGLNKPQLECWGWFLVG
jgi:hypothetical protein